MSTQSLLQLIRVGLMTSMSLGFWACGEAPKSQLSDGGDASPDLRFSGIPVEFHLPELNAWVPVTYASSFHVKCATQGFRARYRYENIGPVPAGAHVNSSAIAGGTVYKFSQAPIGASTLKYAYASFGMVAVPNVPTKLAIRLDSGAAVSEADESNNTWVAKVTRYCP